MVSGWIPIQTVPCLYGSIFPKKADASSKSSITASRIPNLQITAPTMDAGLLEMKEKLHKALRQYKYPPAPTRQEQIVVPATGFLLLIRVA